MNILFVCTGNTCRSPMAKAIFSKIAHERNDIYCKSAGMSFCNGAGVSRNAELVCKEIGIDISTHTAHCITKDDLEKTDIFAVMTVDHASVLISLGVPKEKIHILGGGIVDPYGGDIEIYRKCRDSIMDGCKNLYNIITEKSGDKS